MQIINSQDDGFEMFGGTANAKYILVFGAEDDNLDWVNGWVGKLQYFVAIQRRIDGNNGIEADNLNVNNDALPRSNPTIANLTFVGNRGRGPIEPGSAMLLRARHRRHHPQHHRRRASRASASRWSTR